MGRNKRVGPCAPRWPSHQRQARYACTAASRSRRSADSARTASNVTAIGIRESYIRNAGNSCTGASMPGPPTRAFEADGGARGCARSRATIFELAMPDQASSTAQETGASGLETLRLSNGYVRHVADRGRTPTVKMVCRRGPRTRGS